MTYDINEDAVVIMDGCGFIIGLKEAEGSSDYVFINAFDREGKFSSTTYLAEAFFTDGTKDSIILDKVDGKGIASWTSTSQISLKDGGGDITVGTGVKNAPTVTVLDNGPTVKLWAAKEGSYTSYVFVDLGNASFDGATTDSGDIVYIYDTSYDTEEDSKDEFYTFDAIVNGKKDKISTNDYNVLNTVGLYYKVKRDSNHLVDSVRPVVDGTDDYVVKALTNAAIEQKGKTVIFNQSTPVELYLADGAAIWVIEGDEATKAPTVDVAPGALSDSDKQDSTKPVTLTSSQSGTTITFTVSNLAEDKTATITYVAAVLGTDCQTKGTGAHYKYSKCNKLFSDEGGGTEIAKAPEGAVGEHSAEYEECTGTEDHSSNVASLDCKQKTETDCTVTGECKVDHTAST